MRVLLAEDNPTNEKVARHLLAKLGHTSVAVENSLELLALVANDSKFDCILMDIAMAEMDGIEATRRLIEQVPNPNERPPIIAVTANAFERDRDECMAVGMTDFIPKPLRLHTLRDTLENLSSKDRVPPVEDAPTIDFEHFDAMIDGGDEEMLAIFDDFCDESRQLISRLRSSAKNKNPTDFAKVPRELKGSSATFGLTAFRAHLAELEAAGESGSLNSLPTDWSVALSNTFESAISTLRARL